MNKRKMQRSYTKRHFRNLVKQKRDERLNYINNTDSSDSEYSEPESSSNIVTNISPAFEVHSPCSYSLDHFSVASLNSPGSPHSLSDNVNDDNEHLSHSETSDPDSFEYRFSSSDLSEIELDSDSDDNEDFFYDAVEEKDKKIVNDIHHLLVEHNIDQVTSKHLLRILRENTDTEFPKDPRALLKTPRQTHTTEMEGSNYHHFGLQSAIKKMIRDAKFNLNVYVNNIRLLINIDGAPLQKSTQKSIWPIQCSSNMSNRVYLIGIFYGQGKPKNVDEFLKPLVDELNTLINNDFVYLNDVFTIDIAAFVCDTPAKSILLNVKGHTGYNSCITCNITGQRIGHVTCFPKEHHTELCNNEDFRNNIYLGTYQLGETILTEIPGLNMVDHFPRDYMHLICLGITRKLLYLWKYGPLSIILSLEQISMVSNRLETFFHEMPTDFARRPRSLKFLKQWKATEFRQFLLYTGPVIMKDILNNEMYENFINLHIAVKFLIDSDKVSTTTNVDLAEHLFENFVESFTTIYGQRYVSHNVHNLLHVAPDVRKYGNLDNFSSFSFESFIFFIKKLLRKHNQCLEQIIRRCSEIDEVSNDIIRRNRPSVPNEECKNHHKDGPIVRNLIGGSQYKNYSHKSLTISINDNRNNCVMLKNCIAIRCLNFIQKDSKIFVVGRKFNYENDIFSEPYSSLNFDSYIATESPEIDFWVCHNIKRKMCALSYNDKIVIIPLLHSS